MSNQDHERPRAPRGFAAMSETQRRAIASKGGKAAHARGTAHEWTSEEAAAAGRRGGRGQRADAKKQQEMEIAIDKDSQENE